MPSCKEIATAVSSGEIEQAGLRRRIGIRLHLWICTHCREYIRQMGLLGARARQAARREATLEAALDDLERRVVARCGEAAGPGGDSDLERS